MSHAGKNTIISQLTDDSRTFLHLYNTMKFCVWTHQGEVCPHQSYMTKRKAKRVFSFLFYFTVKFWPDMAPGHLASCDEAMQSWKHAALNVKHRGISLFADCYIQSLSWPTPYSTSLLHRNTHRLPHLGVLARSLAVEWGCRLSRWSILCFTRKMKINRRQMLSHPAQL